MDRPFRFSTPAGPLGRQQAFPMGLEPSLTGPGNYAFGDSEQPRTSGPVSLEDYIVHKTNNRARASRDNRDAKQSEGHSDLRPDMTINTSFVVAGAAAHKPFPYAPPVRSAVTSDQHIVTGPPIGAPREPALLRSTSTRNQDLLETGPITGEFQQFLHTNGDLTIARYLKKGGEWHPIGRIDQHDVSYFIRFCERARIDNQNDPKKLELYQEHITTMVRHLSEKRARSADFAARRQMLNNVNRSVSLSSFGSDGYHSQQQHFPPNLDPTRFTPDSSAHRNGMPSSQAHMATPPDNPFRFGNATAAAAAAPPPQSLRHNSVVLPALPRQMLPGFSEGFSPANARGASHPARLEHDMMGRSSAEAIAEGYHIASTSYLARNAMQAGGVALTSSATTTPVGSRRGSNSPYANVPGRFPSSSYMSNSSNLTTVMEGGQPFPGDGQATSQGLKLGPNVHLNGMYDPFVEQHRPKGMSTAEGIYNEISPFTKSPAHIADFVPRQPLAGPTSGPTAVKKAELAPYVAPASLKELREGSVPEKLDSVRAAARQAYWETHPVYPSSRSDEEVKSMVEDKSQLHVPPFLKENIRNVNPRSLEDRVAGKDAEHAKELHEWWNESSEKFKKMNEVFCAGQIALASEPAKQEAKIGVPLLSLMYKRLADHVIEPLDTRQPSFGSFRNLQKGGGDDEVPGGGQAGMATAEGKGRDIGVIGPPPKAERLNAASPPKRYQALSGMPKGLEAKLSGLKIRTSNIGRLD